MAWGRTEYTFDKSSTETICYRDSITVRNVFTSENSLFAFAMKRLSVKQ